MTEETDIFQAIAKKLYGFGLGGFKGIDYELTKKMVDAIIVALTADVGGFMLNIGASTSKQFLVVYKYDQKGTIRPELDQIRKQGWVLNSVDDTPDYFRGIWTVRDSPIILDNPKKGLDYLIPFSQVNGVNLGVVFIDNSEKSATELGVTIDQLKKVAQSCSPILKGLLELKHNALIDQVQTFLDSYSGQDPIHFMLDALLIAFEADVVGYCKRIHDPRHAAFELSILKDVKGKFRQNLLGFSEGESFQAKDNVPYFENIFQVRQAPLATPTEGLGIDFWVPLRLSASREVDGVLFCDATDRALTCTRDVLKKISDRLLAFYQKNARSAA